MFEIFGKLIRQGIVIMTVPLTSNKYIELYSS